MKSEVFWTASVLASAVLLAAGLYCHGPSVATAFQAEADPFGAAPTASANPLDNGSAAKVDPFSVKPKAATFTPKSTAADPFGDAPDAPDPPKPPKAKDRKPVPTPTLGPREEAIEKALAQPTMLQLPPETPLEEVVKYLKGYHDIQIHVDTQALGDVGLGTDTPITQDLTGISLRSALDLMLGELDLTWTIHHEVLMITTEEVAKSIMINTVYEVADLVTFRNKDNELWEDYDTLIDTILETVDPQSWAQVGGMGNITPGNFGGAKVIVISHTYRMHRKIAELLKRLRAIAAERPSDDYPLRRRPPSRRGMGVGMMGGGMGGGCGCKSKGAGDPGTGGGGCGFGMGPGMGGQGTGMF